MSPLNFQKKLFNNIISDYLRFENLNYSYSIFLNETKLVNNMLTRQEISDYFSKTSKIFRSSTKFQENLSIIHNLLEILCDKKLEKYFLNCHTQTDCDSIKNNFNLNLQSIDNNYIDKLSYYKLGAVSNVEEQMNNYKRNLEARYQADLEAEVV